MPANASQVPTVEDAYRDCRQLAGRHYENFPVASVLLPRYLRDPVAAIYAFARRGDDLADEGEMPSSERLEALDELEQRLRDAVAGVTETDPVLVAVADTVRRYTLPVTLLSDLLTAFRMDVTKHRYADIGELMGYCRYSANPIGRLLLLLIGAGSRRNLAYSDAICSSLQLINFLQDIDADYLQRGRIYIPQEDLLRFGVTESQFQDRLDDTGMRALLDFEIDRARRLLRSGAPLGVKLHGRFAFELRAIVLGGIRVLQRLQRRRGDLFARPILTSSDRLWILAHALTRRGYRRGCA